MADLFNLIARHADFGQQVAGVAEHDRLVRFARQQTADHLAVDRLDGERGIALADQGRWIEQRCDHMGDGLVGCGRFRPWCGEVGAERAGHIAGGMATDAGCRGCVKEHGSPPSIAPQPHLGRQTCWIGGPKIGLKASLGGCSRRQPGSQARNDHPCCLAVSFDGGG